MSDSIGALHVVASSEREALQRASYGAFIKSPNAARIQAANQTLSDTCEPKCTYRAYEVTFLVALLEGVTE